MNELEQKKDIKIQSATPKEARMLAGLAGLINNPDFAEGDANTGPFSAPDPVPSAADQKAAILRPPVAPPKAKPAAVAESRAEDEGFASPTQYPEAIVKTLPERIFTTGRLRVGKDFILKALRYEIHGFADPLYALARHFFGTDDKAAPGVRQFLQAVGQWGRGMVSDEYKLTPVRAMFIAMIKGLGSGGHLPDYGVDWGSFGHKDLWVDALLKRLDKSAAAGVAVSNVRFENEYERLTDAGMTHYHVMCSHETWAKRLKAAGMDPKSPLLSDPSERMAIALDQDTRKHLSLKPNGPKLRVIWNDPEVKCPSPRLITLGELGV